MNLKLFCVLLASANLNVTDSFQLKPTTLLNGKKITNKEAFVDTAVVSATKYVLDGRDDITEAVHYTDGTWLFFSSGRTYTPETAAKKVKLSLLIKKDGSILQLARMPRGYQAQRLSKKRPWRLNQLRSKD